MMNELINKVRAGKSTVEEEVLLEMIILARGLEDEYSDVLESMK